MLSKTELRKLIRAHNVLSKITIPKGATAQDMVKLLEEKNYEVDHENKEIKKKVSRGRQIKLKDTEKILTPKEKTALQKQKASEKKAEKEMEKKKREREIKKKAIADEKGRQTKKVREKLKKEPGRPVVNPQNVKVLGVKGKLYEKEYDEFLKMFNEAKERRSRTPFQELRDRIMRFTEPILVGTASSTVQDGARLKALKEPFMKKIQDILKNVDTQIKKYVKIGRKTVGGLQTRPKKEIKISNKPALNTKKIEPKKKEEPKKEEPIKNERYKITEKFMKDNDIFSQEFFKLYKEVGEQTPEFKKLYKKKQRLIAKYISENGGKSITTELKKLRTPWLQAWIESEEAYDKFLKRYKTYNLISKNDNFLEYLKTRID